MLLKYFWRWNVSVTRLVRPAKHVCLTKHSSEKENCCMFLYIYWKVLRLLIFACFGTAKMAENRLSSDIEQKWEPVNLFKGLQYSGSK